MTSKQLEVIEAPLGVPLEPWTQEELNALDRVLKEELAPPAITYVDALKIVRKHASVKVDNYHSEGPRTLIGFTDTGFKSFIHDLVLVMESKEAPDQQLCKFYGVHTYPELVKAMERHIERLQAKLPKTDSTIRFVREG